VKVHAGQQLARSERLIDDVRDGEDRVERLYAAAEGILVRALEAEDLKTALQAIRAGRRSHGGGPAVHGNCGAS
jgi:hypothetical protein